MDGQPSIEVREPAISLHLGVIEGIFSVPPDVLAHEIHVVALTPVICICCCVAVGEVFLHVIPVIIHTLFVSTHIYTRKNLPVVVPIVCL
jgi:hypothetical protein